MKGKKLFIIAALVLCAAMLSGSALAYEAEGAGNYFSATKDEPLLGINVPRDLYKFSDKLRLSEINTGGDGILAGNTISVSSSSFGGSLRAMGNNISVDDCRIENNITAVGYSVSVSGGTVAGAYFSASSVDFNGVCEDFAAIGDEVTISGTIDGDALVRANKVTVSSSAVITGTLKVASGSEPVIAEGAKIGEPDFTIKEFGGSRAAAKTVFISKLLSRAYWIPASLVICLLLCLLLSKELDGSGQTLLKRPAAMPVTGLITICALPAALVILCLTYIGAPAAGIILLFYIPVLLVSTAFAGASAGRLVFPDMNKILSSMIGVAVLSVLKIVPYLGALISFAAIVYTTGYLVLAVYERIKSLSPPPAAPETLAPVYSETYTPAGNEEEK